MVRKTSFAVLGVAVLLSPLVASAASCVTLTQTLSLGSSGTQVTALQNFFYDTYQGFPTATGYFGTVTQAALQQWQRERGIVSSGSPSTTGYGATGPKTRAAMACAGGSTSSTPTTSAGPTYVAPVSSSGSGPVLTRNLSYGSTGSDVVALQQFLVSLGLLSADSATGYYGSLTQAAVQKYQSMKGIVSSGTPATTGYGAVGAKTRASIAGSSSSGSYTSTIPTSSGKTTTGSTSSQSGGPSLKGATSIPTSSSGTTNANADLSSGLTQLDSQTNSLSSDAAGIDSALNDTPITQISL